MTIRKMKKQSREWDKMGVKHKFYIYPINQQEKNSSIAIWEKHLSRHFTKDYIKMVSKHM